METANDIQKNLKKSKTVMFTNSSFTNKNYLPNLNDDKSNISKKDNSTQVWGQQQRSLQDNVKSEYQSRTRISSASPQKGRITCNYSKKPNHCVHDCWKIAKSCLLCGGDHNLKMCSRYDPNYSSGSADQFKCQPLN